MKSANWKVHMRLGRVWLLCSPVIIIAMILLIVPYTYAAQRSGMGPIDGGWYFSVALKSDGTVWAWGQNDEGQLGDGTTIDRTTPAQVQSLSGITELSSGSKHCLALKSDGTVWAWGWNEYGQLGDGTTVNRTTPVRVPGLSGVTAVASGIYGSSLALKSDGTVWAWGWNYHSELGDGTTINRTTPVQVPGLTGITALAGGASHSLALKSDGTVWAWGQNYAGALGDGTTVNRTTPEEVPGVSGIIARGAGSGHR